MTDNQKIIDLFSDSIAVKQAVITSDLIDTLVSMGNHISEAIIKGNKLMLCGNGGSAADAQHLAAEMLVRLRPMNNRQGIPAIALAQDTSTLTACGNDFGYECLYERMVETLGQPGDVLLGISTSGNSENVIRAANAAKAKDIAVYGFLGAGGGPLLDLCDNSFIVPSDITGRIQESHITAGHALMEHIEDYLIKEDFIQLR